MQLQRPSPDAWEKSLAVLRPALLLGSRTYLQDVQARLDAGGVRAAVAQRHTPAVYDWIVRMLARQGIANAAAEGFVRRVGSPTWTDVSRRLAHLQPCPRLGSYWSFSACGYRRSAGTCNISHHLAGCPVATIPARKGALAQAAIGLRLFIRDFCDDDFVGWIDGRLALAGSKPDSHARAKLMRASLLEPLTYILGTGIKVWSMLLAELLLGADTQRQRWVEAGASFVAVDTLTHNFLVRSGVLSHFDAEHEYGANCYQPGGCADVIRLLAEHIDAREFNADYPRVFPRWIQYACWTFAAVGERNICNGVHIRDTVCCAQSFCPAFAACERLPLQPTRPMPRAAG